MMNFQTMQPLKFSALVLKSESFRQVCKAFAKATRSDWIEVKWSEVKFQAVHQINICWQTCVGCNSSMKIGQDRYHRRFHRLEWFICIDFCSGVSRCSTSFTGVSVHSKWNRSRVSVNREWTENIAAPSEDSFRTQNLNGQKRFWQYYQFWNFHHRIRFRVACLLSLSFSYTHIHIFYGISFPLGRNNQNEILPEYIRT